MQELLGIILRLSVLYLYLLVVMRLTGKRSIGAISPLDFLVALVVGDLFDNIFWGTSSLSSGLEAIAVIIILHALTTFAAFSSRKLDVLLNGAAQVRVVHNSRFDRAGMANQRTSEDEVRSALRLQGNENLKDIQDAFWEANGEMSVIKKQAARDAQKQDLAALREMLR